MERLEPIPYDPYGTRMDRMRMGCACELHLRDLRREHAKGCPTWDIPTEGRPRYFSNQIVNYYGGSVASDCAELGDTLK